MALRSPPCIERHDHVSHAAGLILTGERVYYPAHPPAKFEDDIGNGFRVINTDAPPELECRKKLKFDGVALRSPLPSQVWCATARPRELRR